MKRSVLPLLVFVLWGAIVAGQVTVTWDELADVHFSSVFDEEFGIETQTATFSAHLQSLEGKEVLLTGFLIPVDPLATRYVISRFPNANCFFCGNAGPETIAELRLGHVKRYATDTFATFKGRLQLNAQNLTAFNYVLLDAERVR